MKLAVVPLLWLFLCSGAQAFAADDEEHSYAPSEVVIVRAHSHDSLWGYEEPSHTPNGSSNLPQLNNGTKLIVLDSRKTNVGAEVTYWLKVAPLNDPKSGLWIIEGRSSVRGEGLPRHNVLRQPAPGVAHLPDSNLPSVK